MPRTIQLDQSRFPNVLPGILLAIAEDVDMRLVEDIDILMPKNSRFALKAITLVTKRLTEGVQQVETATAAGTISTAGNVSVTVTGAGITGSPVVLAVPVLLGDTAAVWAAKVRTAIAANAAISAVYTVSGSGSSIILTRIVPAANDGTLNIALADGTSVGVTPAASSANTTAGSTSSTGATLGAINYDGTNIETMVTGATVAATALDKTHALTVIAGLKLIRGGNFLRLSKTVGATTADHIADIVAEFIALP